MTTKEINNYAYLKVTLKMMPPHDDLATSNKVIRQVSLADTAVSSGSCLDLIAEKNSSNFSNLHDYENESNVLEKEKHLVKKDFQKFVALLSVGTVAFLLFFGLGVNSVTGLPWGVTMPAEDDALRYGFARDISIMVL